MTSRFESKAKLEAAVLGKLIDDLKPLDLPAQLWCSKWLVRQLEAVVGEKTKAKAAAAVRLRPCSQRSAR